MIIINGIFENYSRLIIKIEECIMIMCVLFTERMVSLILHSKTHLRLCKHVLHDNINRKGYQHFKITNITGKFILYLS